MDRGIPQPIARSLYLFGALSIHYSGRNVYYPTFNCRFPGLLGIGFAIFEIMMKRGEDLEPNKDHILAPVTLLKVTQTFRRINPGETLEILVKDPDTRMQIFRVLQTPNYQLMTIEEEGSFWRIRLRKE